LKAKRFLTASVVPLMFLVLSLVAIPVSGMSARYIFSEVSARMARNCFFVLSLIIPIMAGMGINFGMVLGAMAGQIGLVFATSWELEGVKGILASAVVGTPIAILLGAFGGQVLNRARGREMITSMMLGLFVSGIYQFFLLYVCGTIIPFNEESGVLLSRGYGIRNSLMLPMAKGIDNILTVAIGGVKLPIATFLVTLCLCLLTYWFRNTKMGQEIRSVGQDADISEIAGIDVSKRRVQSIIISTVLACYGQILYLQNIGTLNTYNGADQAALFAAAALLVGGATVSKAGVVNGIFGTGLFHLLFVLMPIAGKNLTGNAVVGEYLRMFTSYGVVSVSLVVHAWKRQKDREMDRELLKRKIQDPAKDE